MAQPRMGDADHRTGDRLHKAGVTRANNSKCPQCGRKNAYFKVPSNDPMFHARACRYCKYEKGYYSPLPKS